MKTVFLVDDELLSRQSLKTSITWENYGYRLCGESSNGEQALKIISSLHPDVIITDIKMPVMDGLELLRHLKDINEPAKVIVMSCYDEFDYVREAMRLGAIDYLLKHTYEESDLVELLHKLDSIFLKEQTTGEGLKILRQEIFLKIINNNVSKDELNNYIDNDIIPELKSLYMIACFQLSSHKQHILSQQDTQSFTDYIHHSYSGQTPCQLLLLKEEGNNFSLIFAGDNQTSIASLKTEIKNILSHLYQFFESQNISWISGISCHAYSDWNDLKEAYEEAQEMLGEDTEFLGCSTKILAAVDYIKTNYSRAITLEDIAEYAGISRIYLSQSFKKETGQNISDYLIQYRLKKAKKLLLTSNLKVYTIAEMCGFGSVQYFGQIFKKMTGFSPYQFKDNLSS